MEILLEGFGMILWIATMLFLLAFAYRNREKIMRWVNNPDGNELDKEDALVEAKREKEDAEARIKRLERR